MALHQFTFSTMTRCFRSTESTRPVFPLSSPEITITVLVTLANLDGHQITSGASEMIFMNSFSRSSRATGPKMRVPRGSFSLLMSTTAFSSKRM